MNAIEDHARSIFLNAVQCAPDEWPALLDGACGVDAELRKRVDQLLHAHQAMGSIHGRADDLVATVDRPIAERPGTTIGAYKLLEQIGEGGFGVVFMAEQQQPLRRKVALKVLKPGMDTRQVVARFEAERQALALMDHPNIAHVFDGGTTETGRPYFVMELVRGVPITEFCDNGCLPIRQRLELFVDVCQAVQHAHQKGIIHRDIKPTNVMVTLHDGRPVVKVIDFGIAKAMGQQLTEKTLFTNFAQLIGTPLYMSPEQAELSGLDVDTRSDIYALGVLLYELLTGTTPFENERLSQVGYDEMRRIIREEEPPKPSTRISTVGKAATTASEKRQANPRKLSKLFCGELDWIVMKALEKDRNRRYETANAFALDVERFLNDEQVVACPPSATYRLRKFARRKKTTLAMAACVVLAFAGIAGGVGWAVRDNAAREEAIEFDRRGREKALDQVVERSLDETGPLIEDGKWPEALALIERADQLLASASRTERPARLLELREEINMAERLEGIYRGPRQRPTSDGIRSSGQGRDTAFVVPSAGFEEDIFWGRRQDSEFANAFRDFGIDLEALSVTQAAAEINRRTIRPALVKALDGWASLRRRAGGAKANDWNKFLEIARLVDADDWRNRCRDASLRQDRQALERLADTAPVHEFPPATVYLLGLVLRESGSIDKALSVLREGQRCHPDDFWLNDALGYLCKDFFHPPRSEDAVRYYAAALVARPQNASVHRGLAEALQANGALDDALLEYSKSIELEPNSVIAWRGRGGLYRALGRYNEAIADCSKAIEMELRNVWGWQSRSLAFLGAGQYDRAWADANVVFELLRGNTRLELAPHEATAHISLGQMYAWNGQWQEAAAAFDQGARQDSKDGDRHRYAYMYAAAAHAASGDLKAYRRTCHAMLDDFNDPDNVQYAERTAKACLLMPNALSAADFERVQTLAARAVTGTEKHGYFGFFAMAKGLADYRAGRYAEAIAWMERSGPKPNGTHWDATRFAVLAMAHHELEHEAEAAAAQANAKVLVDGIPDPAKGEFFYAGNFHDWLHAQILCREAESRLKKSATETANSTEIERKPRSPTALTSRGDVDRSLQWYGREVTGHSKAIRLDPNDAKVHAGWGQIYARKSQWNEAAASLARAVELDPKDNQSAMRLGFVLAEQGDLPAYQEYCGTMLSRSGKVTDPMLAERTAKACLLLAGGVADPEQLAPLVQTALSADEKHELYMWFLFARGLHDYRCGRFADARTACAKSRERVSSDDGWALHVLCHTVEAMSLCQLGKSDEARQALAEADQFLDEWAPKFVGDLGPFWDIWLQCRILRREAQALMKTPPLETGP